MNLDGFEMSARRHTDLMLPFGRASNSFIRPAKQGEGICMLTYASRTSGRYVFKVLLIASVMAGASAGWILSSGLNAFRSPITADSVEVVPKVVDFGILGFGEEKRAKVFIRNKSNQPIELMPPVSSCGCARATLSATSLMPHGDAELDVRFVAPLSPGQFKQVVYIKLKGLPDDGWSIAIQGASNGSIWANPTKIICEAKAGVAEGTSVILHHLPGQRFGRVVCKDPSCKVERRSAGEESELIELVLHGKQEPSQKDNICIDVYDADDSEIVLRIPVVWKRIQPVRFVPKSVMLPKFGSNNDLLERSVILRFPEPLADLSITTLEPWISILSQTRFESSIIVRIRFDDKLMPDTIDMPVLRLQTDGKRDAVELWAKGER
jgi:hypothetical protein